MNSFFIILSVRLSTIDDSYAGASPLSLSAGPTDIEIDLINLNGQLPAFLIGQASPTSSNRSSEKPAALPSKSESIS